MRIGRYKNTLIAGLLSLLFGSCSKPQPRQAPPQPLREITTGTEDGFVDLSFAIHSHERLPDGSEILSGYGTHHGREVGVAITLGTNWKPGKLGPSVVYTGTVTYRSLGPPSDALIQALDELYSTKLQPTIMRPTTIFTAISLEGEPADLAKGPTKFKLFFESDSEDRYAEFYTNIDLANGVLQIREKDPDYRSPLVKALRQE